MFVDGVHTVVITQQLKCVKMLLLAQNLGKTATELYIKKGKSHPVSLTPTLY